MAKESSSRAALSTAVTDSPDTRLYPPSSTAPSPTGSTSRPSERGSTVSACRATSHGLRRGSENTIAPSVIRLVRTAAAPSSVHGSNVSIAPTLMPSQAKNPSQPASSAATAISIDWAAEPHEAVTPNFMPTTLRGTTDTPPRTSGARCWSGRGRSEPERRHRRNGPTGEEVQDQELVRHDGPGQRAERAPPQVGRLVRLLQDGRALPPAALEEPVHPLVDRLAR